MGSTIERGTVSQRRPRRSPPPPPSTPSSAAGRLTFGVEKSPSSSSSSASAAGVSAEQINGTCDDAPIHKVRLVLLVINREYSTIQSYRVYVATYKWPKELSLHRKHECRWWLWGRWATDSRPGVRQRRRHVHQVWVWLTARQGRCCWPSGLRPDRTRDAVVVRRFCR